MLLSCANEDVGVDAEATSRERCPVSLCCWIERKIDTWIKLLIGKSIDKV